MRPQLSSFLKFLLIGTLFLFTPKGFAQQITIDNVVGTLNFGTFAKNTGGTITVNTDGTVNSTGDIFPVSSGIPTSTVRFEITTKGNSSKLVNITSSSIGLSGPGLLELSVNFSQNNFLLSKDIPKSVYMGGTLTVGGPEDPAGNYTGTVNVTFAFQ